MIILRSPARMLGAVIVFTLAIVWLVGFGRSGIVIFILFIFIFSFIFYKDSTAGGLKQGSVCSGKHSYI